MNKYFKKFKATNEFSTTIGYFWYTRFYFSRRNLFKFYKKYSQKLGGNLIDIGCGNKPYKNLFKHCKSYIGLEIESENKKFCRFYLRWKKFSF